MKKRFFIVALAVLMILTGCASAESPQICVSSNASSTSEAYRNLVSNARLAETFVAKVQKNMDTNTFEGFSYDTTYADCLGKIPPNKLRFARYKIVTELLGCAAVVDVVFGAGAGDKLLLTRMEYTLYPDSQEAIQAISTDVLTKLNAQLGGCTESVTGASCVWEKDGLEAVYRPLRGPDDPAQIIVSRTINDGFPETPSFLPYKLGTDIYTVFSSLKPGKQVVSSVCKPPDTTAFYALLDYLDDGVIVNVGFITDKSGVIKYSDGNYSVRLNDMALNESIDYFESMADRLEIAIGAPDGRGYHIPKVNKVFFGNVTSWGGEGIIKDDLSVQDVLDSKSAYYCLDMYWPGFHFGANYVDDADMCMDFYGRSGFNVK